MTCRQLLRLRMRWATLCHAICLVICSMGLLLLKLTGVSEWHYVSLLGFSLAFVAGLYAYRQALRCPWCRMNLIPLVERRYGCSVGDHVKQCPHCNHQLDDTVEPIRYYG